MDTRIGDDQEKLRRYVERRASATGDSELVVLLELQTLLDAPAPPSTDEDASAGWHRLRAAVDAEYGARYGLSTN